MNYFQLKESFTPTIWMENKCAKPTSSKRARTKINSSGLFLSGPNDQPKMIIYVDEKGNPTIQTFNDKEELKDLIENK